MKLQNSKAMMFVLIGVLFISHMAFAQDANSVVNANNQFTFELYSKYKSKQGNIFFSPFSISSALAMTYEGARGLTADEIQSVFHFPKDDSVRRNSFLEIYNQINKGHEQYQLYTANALWAQKKYPFPEEYLKVIKDYYGGEARNLDFKNENSESCRIINSWIEKQTNYKIRNLISSLDGNTRLVITNAVYFKGKWVEQFEKSNTKDQDFRTSPVNTIKVKTMQLFAKELYYAETDKLQVLELPYEGKELSMFIILPKDNDLGAMEESLSSKGLSDLEGMLSREEVDVYLPKFKFETEYSMSADLAAMGMPTAFGENADFSGMTGKRDLYISQVIHKAFVDVNEEGTEAAAATAVSMGMTSIAERKIKKVFKADHPFIFLIHDNKTGNILFVGRVSNPAK